MRSIDSAATDERRLRAVPGKLAPAAAELAVLSLLAIYADGHWAVVSGSLLSLPREVALISWQAWGMRQPQTRNGPSPSGFDLGPVFEVEPFPGIRAIRTVLEPDRWRDAVDAIGRGRLDAGNTLFSISGFNWSPTGLIASVGIEDPHHVVAGARRPVIGVAATLARPGPLPHSEARWDWPLPPNEPRGNALSEMWRNRHLLHWSSALVGIDWVGTDDSQPPALFVIGRPSTDAWIADVNAGGGDEITISIGWDADQIDPLACTAVIRSEYADVVLMEHQIRLSDLPRGTSTDEQPKREPRTMAWHERTLTTTLPRGAPHTAWGMSLFAPDGRLLDERQTGRRFERARVFNEAEMEAAVVAADQLVADARRAAAERRLSTIGDLEHYLRSRFAYRNGELLLLDPYLLSGDQPTISSTIALLIALDRPIRVLCRNVDPRIAPRLPRHIDMRRLPQGTSTLHDRVWIVGDTGLLVGGSVNTFAGPGRRRRPATTATELPHADVALWREQFKAWWPE
jgi:hypothetical protein